MKTTLKILGHTLFMTICWIIASGVSFAIFGVELPDSEANETAALLALLACCLLNVLVLHFYLLNSAQTRVQRFLGTFILIFGIQFFMSQMESLYFLTESQMEPSAIYATVLSGLMLAFAYAGLTAFTYKTTGTANLRLHSGKTLIYSLVLLSVVAYPVIYQVFGYFIAWQNESLRAYYSGSTEIKSFFSVVWENFGNGIYFFQVFRSLLWIGMGWLAIHFSATGLSRTSWIVGFLFAILMNSQHLLPNPYMPDEIRFMHAIETTGSNLIWGMLIVWALVRKDG